MLVRVSNILPKNYWAIYLRKKIFVISKVRFHHEGGLSQSRYFELFFSTRYEAPPQKKSALTEPPFLLFQMFCIISAIFFGQKCPFSDQKKWHFEWPNQNSKTTFIVQTFPKNGPYGFDLVNLSLLGPILAKFQFC